MVSRPSHYNSRYKHDLSPRQRDVLELIALGKTNAEIAEELGLTLDGAKWHVREILGKLEVESRDEAAAWWREYRRPLARLSRAITGIAGVGAVKVAAVGGGVAVLVAGVTLGVFALMGRGDDGSASASLPACRAENMRWESSIERAGDDVRLSVSIGLREPDWYEGLMRHLRLSDRRVDSPCLLDSTVGVELSETASAPGGPPNLPLRAVSDVTNAPSLATVHVELRRGVQTDVVSATFSNWCKEALPLAWQIDVPALFAGQSPTLSSSLMVPIPAPPACGDANRPAEIGVLAIDATAPFDPAALPACDPSSLGLRLDVGEGYGQAVVVRALAFPPRPCRIEQFVELNVRDETTGRSFGGVRSFHTVVWPGGWVASAVLSNWCAADPHLVAAAISVPIASYTLDIPPPACVDASHPPTFSAVARGNSARPDIPAPPANRTYYVKPGDTLENIARSYGVTVEALLEANPGLTSTNLVVGQALSVPPPP
jgi:DNA-binding CsgD family transcriptional regulator/phage tail protein X